MAFALARSVSQRYLNYLYIGGNSMNQTIFSFPTSQNALSLIGRALVAMLFLPAGVAKLLGFAGVTGYIASKGVPLPQAAAAIAILVEVGVISLLLVGWQTRWAALTVAIFTTVITFIFHPYWAVPAEAMTVQKLYFYKNFAIVGGLLLLCAFGPGGWSVDARRGNK